MPAFEGTGPGSWALPVLMGQRSILGFVVLITWLVMFYMLLNVWLLCIFTSLLVVLGGWLGSHAALNANSLLHLEHFLPLGQAALPHVSSESERRLDWEIHCAVEKAVRDFVISWYSNLVSEEEGEFQQEIRNAMLAAAAELKRRARRVDRRVLAQRMLELYGCHLQSFSQAKELQKLEIATFVQPQQQEASRSTLWRLYSKACVPHPALASSAAELCYSKAVVDLLLHVLVPYPHLETRTGRYLVGELITCNVLLPLVAQISNPDWLNQTIVDVFTKSAVQEPDSMTEEPPSLWDRDFHSPLPWEFSESSSMQTARSNSTLPLQESSESSLQTPWTFDDSTKGGVSSESEGAATSTPEILRSPSRLYRNTGYDIESLVTDNKKISNESLSLNDSEDKDETFCDCINPADFCGLVCLDDDTLALLGKRIRPKLLISEPLSRPESPMEESLAGTLPQANISNPGGPYLSPFGLESLGIPDGPVVIKNLRITGTVTAKEQKGNSSHPYTLYTVKYETAMDTDSLSTDQAVGYHTVNRRYSEFLNLQTRLEERSDLKKVIKNVKGPKKLFPDLSFGPDAEKVEARKGQLESFLKKLCSIPEAARSEEVQEFLALNTDASAAFEKKPLGSLIDKMVENIVDTLKTAFPRSEPQSPTDDGEPDADGRTPDSRKKSRLRFSSIIAPTPLSVPDFQPKITYCFSEGSQVFKGPLGLEGFVQEQEKRVDGEPRKSNTRGVEQEEKEGERAAEKRTRGTDTALADVALNILCLLMKDQWSWLCTENIQKTIRLLFGTIIERWLEVGIAHLTSAPCWVIYLRVLQEAVWPGGDLPMGPQPERSPEQREKTRLQCLDCLMKLFPELISDLLGCEKYKLSWEHVLESLQDPHINRHLVYCIFDLLLEFLVPESSDEGFQKSLLHSLSCEVEATSLST